jgi:hypothetical protein
MTFHFLASRGVFLLIPTLTEVARNLLGTLSGKTGQNLGYLLRVDNVRPHEPHWALIPPIQHDSEFLTSGYPHQILANIGWGV